VAHDDLMPRSQVVQPPHLAFLSRMTLARLHEPCVCSSERACFGRALGWVDACYWLSK
jgi:hypothetical protein